ncbi:hypothetical protein [uncultured Methanospirillum sp.]|uniref:ComEC/Rec2 family competence protein n=1 Tax=uncultured Methanospirillum sp. TaxID=262503 RepID=UPI0029C62852|nr:hypothetical protein [uncultured Methanospirillum sp.]
MSSSYCIIALLFCFLIFTPVSADLKVHFLDVNEGDAVLLQTDGKNMLIDSGTASSGNLTKHYLKSLKISDFDQVLVTSPEEGRTGGLTNILNDTPARHYSDGGWNVSDGSYRDVITKLDEDQIPRTKVLAGSDIQFAEGVNITIVSPSDVTGEAGADTLVPLITYGNTRLLLMGSQQSVPGNVSAQIMRVADHGSRQGTDPGFVMKVHPEIAIVSTGEGNPVGNPIPTTLNILQTAGAQVMRTDSDGTITITTDGTDYSVGKLRMEPEITLSLISVVETRPPA